MAKRSTDADSAPSSRSNSLRAGKQHKISKRKATPASWKPGQSGNPKGRPPKPFAMTTLMAELAEVKDFRGPDGKKRKRKIAVVEKIYSEALQKGEPWALRMVFEKLDGVGEPGDQQLPQTSEEQIWLGVMAFIRRATDDNPDLKKKFIDAAQALRKTS